MTQTSTGVGQRRAPVVHLVCVRCGKPFTRLAHRHRQRGKRGPYCSRECLNRRVERTCEVCGKHFERIASDLDERALRFCSIACKEIGWARPLRECDQCGVTYKPPNNKSRFCSHACYADWLSESGVVSGANSPLWLGGLGWNRTRGDSWPRQRRSALKRDHYACCRCGVKRDQVRRLVVHHRIPYRLFDGDHEAANDLGNLVTLCDHCHTLTEWELRRGERLF